jgi:thiamine-phosphate pyrophosphorylase
MNNKLKNDLRLYFVMGSPNCLDDPLAVLHGAIQGGITAFQFREKGKGALTGQAAVYLGRELSKLCKTHGVLFMVNDDVELALELDAHGIHIGQEDESLLKIKPKMTDKIIGVSAHDIDEARAAVLHGADYLGVGPMYATLTKLDAQQVKGPTMIRDICHSGIDVPIVGIGGISADNAQEVIHSGADGVAVVSAISLAVSPRDAAAAILRKINQVHSRAKA